MRKNGEDCRRHICGLGKSGDRARNSQTPMRRIENFKIEGVDHYVLADEEMEWEWKKWDRNYIRMRG